MKKILFATLALLLMSANVAMAKDLTIMLAFGTSDKEATKSLDAIGKAYTDKGDEIMWVYTSSIIRNKLAKQGKEIYSMTDALKAARKQGYKDITIQSLHVLPAEEYMEANREISRYLAKHPKHFKSVMIGHPLVCSTRDVNEAVDTILRELPKNRKANEAVILLGHGNNRGTGDPMLMAINNEFQAKDPLVWLACVEGAVTFDSVLPLLKKAKVKKVWLMPFMIVAGDHAKNDMAGPEADSWASILEAEGYKVKSKVVGMGEYKGIQEIFVRHSHEAFDDILNNKMISAE